MRSSGKIRINLCDSHHFIFELLYDTVVNIIFNLSIAMNRFFYSDIFYGTEINNMSAFLMLLLLIVIKTE